MVYDNAEKDNAACYAMRYHDLQEGYCHNDVTQCNWESLRSHWETHGRSEGRRFSCINKDTKCYLARYEDLMELFCPGQHEFDTCNFRGALHHWATSGEPDGRTLECESAETICYVQRNPDLLETYCQGLVTDCAWPSVIEHMVKHGEKEGRPMGCMPPARPPLPPPPPRKSPPPSPSPTPPMPPPPPMVVIGANGQPVSNLAAGSSSPFGGVVIIITIGIVAMATVIYCFCRLYTAMMGNHEIETAGEESDSHTGYDEEQQYYDDEDDNREFVAKKKKSKKKSKKKQRETFSGDYD